MGRPTKIEGNPEHPASLGAADSFTQAEILNLYDPDRAKVVTQLGETRSWGQFLTAIKGALGSAGFRILTGPITSPSLAAMLNEVLTANPQIRWHQFDPTATLGQAPGTRALYHFDRADVVVTLDADFINSGPGSVRYQRDFAARRRLTDDQKQMNRLYAIESTPSLTGAKADHRLPVKASEIEAIARALSAAVGGGAAQAGSSQAASVPRPGVPDIAKFVGAVAKDLQAHRGRSVVVAGDFQPASVHQLARSMNEALGNVGTTVTYGVDVEVNPTDRYASIRELAQAIDAGQVTVLLILGGNPVFTAPADLGFAEKLSKVGMVAYHSSHVDETSHLSHWNLPAAHALESWGDARAYDGTVTLTQPLIAPLYEGRSEHEVIAMLTAQADRRGMQIVKDYWTGAFSSGIGWDIAHPDGDFFASADAFWTRALHDGFMQATATGSVTGAAAPGSTEAAQQPGSQSPQPPGPSPEPRTPDTQAAQAQAGGLEIDLPPGPDDRGRPPRQQRLAAGAAEADHAAHVGHRGVDQPATAGRRSEPEKRRRRRATTATSGAWRST
jgi:hypothetical protein